MEFKPNLGELAIAIIKQAVKDGAVHFFYTEWFKFVILPFAETYRTVYVENCIKQAEANVKLKEKQRAEKMRKRRNQK